MSSNGQQYLLNPHTKYEDLFGGMIGLWGSKISCFNIKEATILLIMVNPILQYTLKSSKG